MRCLIADDNKLALTVLNKLLEQVEGLEVVASCKDAMDAYNYLKENSVDVAILDVEMPGMTGVELIQALPVMSRPLIILSTSNPAYAANAYDLEVTDYILKPVTLPRLLKSIDKIKQIFKAKATEFVDQQSKDFFFFKDKGSLVKLKLADVFYAEAMGDYVKIYTGEKWYMVGVSLRTLEEKYPESFTRVHRSYAVALSKIQKIDDGIIYMNEHKIPLADSYKKELLQKINML